MTQPLNILHHIPESYETLSVLHVQKKQDTGRIPRSESPLRPIRSGFNIQELVNWEKTLYFLLI